VPHRTVRGAAHTRSRTRAVQHTSHAPIDGTPKRRRRTSRDSSQAAGPGTAEAARRPAAVSMIPAHHPPQIPHPLTPPHKPPSCNTPNVKPHGPANVASQGFMHRGAPTSSAAPLLLSFTTTQGMCVCMPTRARLQLAVLATLIAQPCHWAGCDVRPANRSSALPSCRWMAT